MNSRPPPAALGLLVQVHLVQAWRRLKDVRRQSRLLTSLIALFLAGYAVLAFALFHQALRFVGAFPGLGPLLIERLIFLLFAFLFVLLVFSNLILSYTNCFRNRETAYLLTLPLPPGTVFQWKLMESTLLASWAFLFLVAPLLVAYGMHARVPWHFYAATPLLLVLFLVLPGVLGAWAALHCARFLDRRTFQIAAVAGAVLLLASAAFWLQSEPVTEDLLESRVLVVLDRLLVKTRFAQFPFLPSYWLASAVLQWGEGAVSTAVFFLLVLLSYALFFGGLAFAGSGGWFYAAQSAVHSRGSVFWQWTWFRNRQTRRQRTLPGQGFLDRVARRVPGVSDAVRAIWVKDLRVFWRDTTQWGQTLVLFGLLGGYVLNLRHFSQQLANPFWVQLVSHLNLAACALNLATLTTRFVFPQFSLEGKRLWIVGMAPLGLAGVVRAKFALATAAALVLTVGLLLLSCHMLQMPAGHTLYFVGAVTVMTFTLNGLAVGLGTLYPNLREEHPGKIVSGFGGTLCLVLSFLYILSAVLLLAVGTPWPWGPAGTVSLARVATAVAAFLLLSAAAGAFPLWLALRRLRRFEV